MNGRGYHKNPIVYHSATGWSICGPYFKVHFNDFPANPKLSI